MAGINIARNIVTVKNGQMQSLNVGGNSFWCEDSGGQAFTLKIANSNTVACKEGVTFPVAAGFNTLTIVNDLAGADITVIIWTGSQGVAYFPKTVTAVNKDGATFVVVTDTFAIGAGVWSAAFTGVGPAGQQRKHFIVSNQDAAADMFIGDGTKKGVLCPAKQSRIVAVSGSVKIFNAGGGPANASVLEVFYS